MSWMKRAQGSGAPQDQQRYAAPQGQPFGNQQNTYTNYQGSSAGAAAQQQYWQTPPQQQPQYNQQYGQIYQQDYRGNANQYYQQQPTQYGQNYPTQSYGNNVPQGYQPNYYPNQTVQQQNYSQNKGNTNDWDDNWDWGWEDSSKAQKEGGPVNVPHMTQAVPQQVPQQMYNNANVIEESFGTTDSWNWSMEEKQEVKDVPPATAHETEQPAMLDVGSHLDNNLDNDNTITSPLRASANAPLQPATEDVKTLNDKEIVKERMPNLALGKRFHLDNLTPQWSIESQMSQDSSDGPLTQSEGGTFRSELQSRNSDKSNYSQHSLDEPYQNPDWSQFSTEEPTLAENCQSGRVKVDSHSDLTSSMQEMSIANRENPTSDGVPLTRESNSRNSQEQVSTVLQPPLAPSPANLPTNIAINQLSSLTSNMPVPSVSPVTLPPPPSSSAGTASLPPHPSPAAVLPPSNFPPTMASQNPFKHAGPFSHKSTGKTGSSSNLSNQSFPSSMSNASPSVVSKVPQLQHSRVPASFGANLETTPDNSERPDQLQVLAFRPMPVAQQVPENLEVAPKNDRNEYLQTAHLSSVDYGDNTDFSRNMPPPGLRRMVVGQQESEYNQSHNMSGDEPPPSFARMVPGQQNEGEINYNQPSDNYLDRHIDGQPTDNSGHPYRQADGQQTPDNYTQPAASRGGDRRPIGLDRMVPGEPSNDEYSQYQASSYTASNEQRVVMGVDHDYNISADAGPSDVREQNVDGSDYTVLNPRNPPRNIINMRESNKDTASDFHAAPEEEQREVIMEGENLQDLSIISSTELTFTREHAYDGADMNVTDASVDRKTDVSDSMEQPAPSSRRQSLNQHVNTSGDDSERDRLFKSSPRRDKHRSSKDRDRDRDKEGRYSRGERGGKYEREADRRAPRDRDERRPEKERRDRDHSPDGRRHRRHRRYDTEDTDYYSDRERERRRYREGSYTSKPPRPDDKERRRYDTVERERSRRYEGERRSERRYRDIDPGRKRGNLQRERDEDDRRRVVTFSRDAKTSDSDRTEGPASPARAASREPRGTDDERERRRTDSYRRGRHARNYYDGYEAADPYLVQRQQYQYYEHLRHTNPAAYMEVYQQIMAGQPPPPPPPDYNKRFMSLMEPRDRGEERASVHSGRSSANDLKGHDTLYYGCERGAGAGAGGGSLRTVGSDRDLTTDASLNLHLEESTVRSERMTPFKFSTAHIKGSISSRNVVVVRPTYPVDGLPATVHVLALTAALRAARDPALHDLDAYPGPLIKGVTHKKSVVEYCQRRARAAGAARGRGARDPLGAALLWDLLALLLRQNGVVVGTDIAELLMKNKREYEYNAASSGNHHGEVEVDAAGGRRESSLSGSARDEDFHHERTHAEHAPSAPAAADLTGAEPSNGARPSPADEPAALDHLRELLIYGNRQEAIEWAMSCGLWGHALQLSAHSGRRARAAVAQRFVAGLPRQDPLHTLYTALQARLPPAVTSVCEERRCDWRPHAAIVLANGSASPDQDRRTLLQLGDSLSSRGLVYSAQFCYISGGEPFSRHPLAPLSADAPPSPAAGSVPRLSLLLADPRASTLAQFATNDAIFATEIYEYAMSLNQEYIIEELQVYKLLASCRLVDAGEYERALAYGEQAARTVTRAPARYSPRLLRALADLADRLKYHDPALSEGAVCPPADDSGEPSPDHQPYPHPHQWLDDVKMAAEHARLQHAAHTWEPQPSSQHPTPTHHADHYDLQPQPQPQLRYPWSTEQPQQQFAAPPTVYSETPAAYAEPPPPAPADDAPDYTAPDYTAHYYHPPPAAPAPAVPQPAGDDQPASYWPQEHYHYGEVSADGGGAGGTGGTGGVGAEPRPMITMPGGAGGGGKSALYGDYDDDRPPSADQSERDGDTAKSTNTKSEKGREESLSAGKEGKRSGWLGGLFTKLSLRPPNQMILPDDKNPTIVWDEQNKRWRNTDGDEDGGGHEGPHRPPPPPPLGHHAHPARSASPPLSGAGGGAGGGAGVVAPPSAPVSNIFKMQKGRHIKNSYVDVLNPGGARNAAPAPLAAPLAAPLTAPLAAPPAYFVPAPLPHQVIELPPSPAPTPPPVSPQGGAYEESPAGADYDQYRSGI